jgi:hypothetical protein
MRNCVKCRRCNKVLRSRHRKDRVQCGCPNATFTDGGMDYQRYGGVDLKLVLVLESPREPYRDDPFAFPQE